MCVCCFVQDCKNRELGAENGQLQRRVLTLTEHERQLNEVSIINQQQQQQKNGSILRALLLVASPGVLLAPSKCSRNPQQAVPWCPARRKLNLYSCPSYCGAPVDAHSSPGVLLLLPVVCHCWPCCWRHCLALPLLLTLIQPR